MIMRTLVPMVLMLALAGCGGGGGSSSAPTASAPPSNPAPPQVSEAPGPGNAAPVDTVDLSLAERLYQGDARTPAGFDVEARPAHVTGMVATRHLKNTDLANGPQSMGASYEACTHDMAQALEWSERQATWQGQYSDLVEIRSDARLFEVMRVPRSDVTAMIRHRVFRCDYLDRAGTDLRSDTGAAGLMNQRPLNATELEALAEYLWQFTLFNNSDYAVQSSVTETRGDTIVQTIRMGQLIRGATSGCDTVQLLDWTHTMNAQDGTLTRSLSQVRSFSVKSAAGAVERCAI